MPVKMKLGYDNLEDAKSKLMGTFCLYKGKAFHVKNLWNKEGTKPEDHKYVVNGMGMSGKLIAPEAGIEIDDPQFNCSDYNIGYLNAHGVASWFYRIPYKQYKQGLTSGQVTSLWTNPAYGNIEFRVSKGLGEMLENNYPTYRKAADALIKGDVHVMAFHKNFAMSRDTVHDDFVIEYKGKHIGFTPNLEDFKLLAEHEHLYESLKEITQK